MPDILGALGTLANVAKEMNRLDLYKEVVELMEKVGEQADENYKLNTVKTFWISLDFGGFGLTCAHILAHWPTRPPLQPPGS